MTYRKIITQIREEYTRIMHYLRIYIMKNLLVTSRTYWNWNVKDPQEYIFVPWVLNNDPYEEQSSILDWIEVKTCVFEVLRIIYFEVLKNIYLKCSRVKSLSKFVWKFVPKLNGTRSKEKKKIAMHMQIVMLL